MDAKDDRPDDYGKQAKELAAQDSTKEFLSDPDNVRRYIGPDINGGVMLLKRLQEGDLDAYDEFAAIANKVTGHLSGWGLDPENETMCTDPISASDMKITFADIAGAKRAKQELMIGFVYPAQFPNLFTKTSSGVLLYGPPGTGKTLLAKAAVTELSNVTFYAPSPADLKGKYIGETEKNIRRVFMCALKDRPAGYKRSIIFFDEFEGIAGKRGDSEGMNSSVTALLQAMDGITSDDTVSVLAATNFPEQLDSAVLRRFSSQIFVDLPTFEARLYLVVRALSRAYNSLAMRDIRELNLKLTPPQKGEPAAKWKWACNCDFMEQLEEYGTLYRPDQEHRLKDCHEISQLSRLINNDDIIDLISMTGPCDKKETKQLMETTRPETWEFSDLAVTEYGFSGSDIDKLMDTIVRNAATRALDKNLARIEDSQGTLIHVAVSGDRADLLRTGGTTVTEKKVWQLDETKRLLVQSFDVTLFDFCVGLQLFKGTIKNYEYKQIVGYSKS